MSYIITTDKPTKTWRGKSRLAKKYYGRSKILDWAISINPGDWIATCEGCNRQVANIEYEWCNVGDWFKKPRDASTWVLREVIFTDTHGTTHCCPGGGCALPRESIEAIEAYQKEWADYILNNSERHSKETIEAASRNNDALKNGGSVVDKNGEYLPLFDSRFCQ